MNAKPVERLREIISGTDYRRAVGSLPGYAVADAGSVKTVQKFFRENS
ncbi:hypothetical protein [Borborobacter arsenicus]